MTVPEKKVYPRTGDTQTVYLKNVVTNPNITVGEYTIYNDFGSLSAIMCCITILSTGTS